MILLPKLLFLALLGFVAWYATRWISRAPTRVAPRRAATAPRQAKIEAVDLTACAVCGSYVAANAKSCGRADCPRPR